MSRRGGGYLTRRIGVFLGIVLVASGLGLAGTRSTCVTARVDAPIRLPDGSVYPSGGLTLCDSMSLSPVASVHKAYVDGLPTGLLVSRRTESEGADEILPTVFFRRLDDGTLGLYGYVLPGRERSVTYLLDEKRPARRRSGQRATTASLTGPLVVVPGRAQ